LADGFDLIYNVSHLESCPYVEVAVNKDMEPGGGFLDDVDSA